MSRILWHGISKEDAEANLNKVYLPADPKAKIEKRGDGYVIIANAMVDMVPQVVKKK